MDTMIASITGINTSTAAATVVATTMATVETQASSNVAKVAGMLMTGASLVGGTMATTVAMAATACAGLIYLKNRMKERETGIPLASNFEVFDLIRAKDEDEAENKMKQMKKKYGDLFMISIAGGLLELVNVMDAELARIVLKNDEIFPKYRVPTAKTLYDFVGFNIFTSSGDEWNKHKAIASSSLSFSSVQHFFPSFLSFSSEFIETKLLPLSSSSSSSSSSSLPFDVHPLLVDFTIDILCETIFGYSFNEGKRNKKEYIDAYNELMKNYSDMSWIVFPFLEKLPLEKVTKMHHSIQILTEFFDDVIQKHLQLRSTSSSSSSSSSSSDLTTSPRRCMLQTYLDYVVCDEPALTLQELRADMFVFLIAGHETTALSMTWTLYLLSKHEDIQERLYQEIYSVIQDRDPVFEDLKKMPYLTRVIKEAMRIEPPVLNIPTRKTTKDMHIEGTSFIIPKDSVPTIHIKAIHNDPRYWNNPERFDPDRFLIENSKGRHGFAYMPFALGKRMCIGSQFAMIEQELTLAMILRKFKVGFVDQEVKRVRGYLNVPQHLFVTLHQRS